MEVTNSGAMKGSLQISTDVISKIAKLATLEVEGIYSVSGNILSGKGFALVRKMPMQKPISVELNDDVAEISVNVVVKYGCKIPQLSEKVQENVKNAVQNMTCITVSKVNVIVTGVVQETTAPVEDEE